MPVDKYDGHKDESTGRHGTARRLGASRTRARGRRTGAFRKTAETLLGSQDLPGSDDDDDGELLDRDWTYCSL